MARKKSKRGKSNSLSVNQITWKKITNNLRRKIRRAEKQGFVFIKNIIPDKPKRITAKALKELSELSAEYISYAQYNVYGVGGEYIETVSGSEGRAIRRREGALKASATRRTKEIATPENESEYSKYRQIYENILALFNRDAENFTFKIRGNPYIRSLKEDCADQLVDTMITEAEKHGLIEYAKYLETVKGAIDVTAHSMFGESEEEPIKQAFDHLTKLLKQEISFTELKEIGEKQEKYEQDWII